MMEFRHISSDEWEIWKIQRLAALKEAPYAFRSKFAEWENAPEEQWRERLSIHGSFQLIVFLHGTAVGMVGGLPTDEPRTAELVSMQVAPAARGSGVGSALLAAIEGWARDAGVARLRLEVVKSNRSARDLYRRNGFVEVVDLKLSAEGLESVMMKELQ